MTIAARSSGETQAMKYTSVTSSQREITMDTSFDFLKANGSTSYAFAVYNSTETLVKNNSFADDCQKVIFSELEFLPWDNSDNLVCVETEEMAHRVKDTMLVLLFVIGGPGNVINMAVFYKQGLKDRVNLLLFALSFTDELYLIMAMFHHAEQIYLQFLTKDRYGPMNMAFVNNGLTGVLGLLYTSVVLSAIIASERCLCVLNPLKFRSLMRTRTMAVIIIVVYILTVGLYVIVAFRVHVGCIYDPETGTVVQTVVMGEFYRRHTQLVNHLDSFVFGVGLPGIVLVVIVTATIITIVKLRQIVTWRAGTTSSLSPREVALTKMLVGTSILLFACAFPFAVARICWLIFPEINAGGRHHNFYLTTLWMNELLTYINSTFNIFAYYVMGSHYRKVFWELFRIKPMQKITQQK